MFPFFDNVITFGADTFATNDSYRKMLIDLFVTAMSSPDLGADDRCVACKIGESILLNLPGSIDDVRSFPLPSPPSHLIHPMQAIAPIVERSMHFILSAGAPDVDKDFVVTVPLFLHSLELIITAIFYNPALTLTILDAHDWTRSFFSQWFKHLASFTRVHDRKLGIAAICALLEWLAGLGDAPLAQSSNLLLTAALVLFKGFPEAVLGEFSRRARRWSCEWWTDFFSWGAAREEYVKSLEETEEEDEEEDVVDDDEDEDGEGEPPLWVSLPDPPPRADDF